MKGIWGDTPGGTTSTSAIVLSNGDAWIVFNEAGVTTRFARLQTQSTGANYTGTGTQYLLQTGAHEAVTASGTFTEKILISGTITPPGGNNLNLSYDSRYETPAKLSDAVGSWTGTFGGNSSLRTLVVTAAGSLSGNSTTGCTYNGTLLPRTADTAVFDVSFTEACVIGTPTDFSGIATLNAAKTGLSIAVTTADKANGALFVGSK
jgi:hypothetical protein